MKNFELSNKQYNKLVAKIDRDILWDHRRIDNKSSIFSFDNNKGYIFINHLGMVVVIDHKRYHDALFHSFKEIKAAIKMAELASLLP